MDRELGDFKAVMMTRDGSVTVTDRLRADALRRSIEKRADHLLFVQVTRIVSERTGLDQPEVWETVPQSALIVEEPDLPPTLIEQRDACRATAAELLASVGRDCNMVTQAIHWTQHADRLQARIDAGEQ
jgi:hypothetical protein